MSKKAIGILEKMEVWDEEAKGDMIVLVKSLIDRDR